MSDQEEDGDETSLREDTVDDINESKYTDDNKTMVKPKREPDLKNLARVSFTPAITKDIISKHSGSILVKEEPILELTTEYVQKGSEAFRQHSFQQQVNEEKMDNGLDGIDIVSSSNLGNLHYYSTVFSHSRESDLVFLCV